MNPDRRVKNRCAFTVIELLVMVGVLFVLIGILAPALGRSREGARRIKCAAQLSSHVSVLTAYATDNRDTWPFAEGLERRPASPPVPGEIGEPAYACVGGLWHIPVLDAYDQNPFHESLVCPSDDDTRATQLAAVHQLGISPNDFRGTLGYRLSMAMYLDARALDPGRPSYDARYFVVQTHTAVVFPSQKGCLFDSGPFHDVSLPERPLFPAAGPVRRNVAAVDGSVAHRSSSSGIPGVPMPGTYRPGGEAQLGVVRMFDFTPNGVRGRDW